MKEMLFAKTYTVTDELAEELDRINPLVRAAMKYQEQFSEYLFPYSYWTDKDGRLYIRWSMFDGGKDRPVWRYFYDEKGDFHAEEIK